MKISLSWLKRYVDINVTVDELCDKMVMTGFEVESIDDLSKTMENIVAAKINKIIPHPDSDHLQICMMDCGCGEDVQIVTGAQNVFEGALVPAALNNSLLPNGTKIKKGKLRGVESNGMLCSGEELCLKDCDYPGAEVNGILILRDEYAPGTDMREILGLNDIVIDFKITANRPDCQSVLGVAREVGVVLGTEFKMPSTEYKVSSGDINDHMKVDVLNYDLCPRYVGRVVKNIRIAESPDWMKQCVKAAGMRPINNIVDITNFVMLETGQPMHAFDMRDIEGKHIIVRNAENGEHIVTLDGNDHELTSEMLVIADGSKPSCLAGIMGGLNSEIKDDTTDLFLESAKFRRDNVRRTSRALGLRTESSGRFERGIDINNTSFAMDRALALICELNCGDVIDGTIDRNIGLPEPRKLTVSVDSINDLLGLVIPDDTMVSILNRLGLKAELSDGMISCLIPSSRDDIEGRADIAEEVMRIYGYDHIVGTPMRGNVTRGRILPERKKTNDIKRALLTCGMNEIATYSFIGSKAISTLHLKNDDARLNGIKLINPLGDEYSVLRTQLVTSMMTVLSTNYNNKNVAARLFEISKRFIPVSLPVSAQPDELPTLCIGIYGQNEDFLTLKGAVEDVIDLFGAEAEYERSSEPWLHPGRQASILLNGQPAGVFGEVHPKVAAEYDIDTRCYVAEIKLDVMFGFEKPKTLYKALPRFPAVTRDFAMLCDADTPVSILQKAVRTGAGKLCEKVVLFDVYSGSQIPDGMKSVAISAVLRSSEGTLTDEQIDRAYSKIVKNLETAGASLRK